MALRVDLEGTIQSVETWISTKEFYRWCESRNLQKGEICSAYDDGECNIFDHAENNAYDMRKGFEAPYFDANYTNALKYESNSHEILKDQYEILFRENIILQCGFPIQKNFEFKEGALDRPIRTTEKNCLLAIIAVLCHETKYDYTRHSKTAGLIKKKAEEMGLSIGESTIENHLKKIPDALGARMR